MSARRPLAMSRTSPDVCRASRTSSRWTRIASGTSWRTSNGWGRRAASKRRPLGPGDGRPRGWRGRPRASGREVPSRRAKGSCHGITRDRGAHAMRLRPRADAQGCAGRQSDAMVVGPPGRAIGSRLDGRRLELLQSARAAPRGRARDPRAHPPAAVVPEAAAAEGRASGGGLTARLYTRTGDAGTTGLLGPERVSKDDPRVEAMGAVDELNAVIGLALLAQRDKRIRELLGKVQDDLFTVGAELAMAHGSEGTKVPRVTPDHVARLEAGIESLDIGKVTEFILPRGSEGLVRLHWARTVARRAERRVVTLSKREPVNPELLRYLNRLSSLLYQMAVWVQRKGRTKPKHPTYAR